MDRKTNRSARAANSVYRRKFQWLRFCVYCGETATCLDHVLPLCIAMGAEFWRDAVRRAMVGGLWLVPACHECNILAGATPFLSIRAKRQFIKSKLKKRYRRLLRGPLWDAEELSEIEGQLNHFVASSMHRRLQIELRLAWPAIGRRWPGKPPLRAAE